MLRARWGARDSTTRRLHARRLTDSPRVDDSLELIEDAAPAFPEPVAELGRWEAALDEPHPGLPALQLEEDLHLGVDVRAVRQRHRRSVDEAIRSFDFLEHVRLYRRLATGRSERDAPPAAD